MTSDTQIGHHGRESRRLRGSRSVLVALLGVFALVAAACGGDDDAESSSTVDDSAEPSSTVDDSAEPSSTVDDSAEPSSTVDDSAEDVTLRWAMWTGSQEEVDAWMELADMVSVAYPNITIEFETNAFGDHFTKLTTDLAAGQAACITGMQSLRALGFVDALLPLDDRVAATGLDIDDFDASIIDGLTAEGALRAIPYDFGPVFMFYNKDAFAAAGVDEPQAGWTIEEFEATAAALTGDGKFGFAASEVSFWYRPLIHSYNGASFVTPDSTLNISDPAVAEGLEWYRTLVTTGVSPEVGGAGYDPVNEFAVGNAAMAVDGPWDLINIDGVAEFELGVVELPGQGTLTAGSGFGITTDCDHPDEAFDAISVITGPQALARLAELGRAYPARESQQAVFFDVAPFAEDGLLGSVEGAAPFRTSPEWDRVDEQLAQFGAEFINGTGTAQEFIGNVEAAVSG
jgi:multiple sugar transport system substrate-binding protein